MLELIDSNQHYLITLVETRGVGIYPFKNVIDEISNYIQNNLTKLAYNPKDSWEYTFIIPKNITKKITFINSLEIKITVKNNMNYYQTGGGSNRVGNAQRVINTANGPKLNLGAISVLCPSTDKQLLPRALYLNLYHEFNHAYENYKTLDNSDNSNSLYFMSNKTGYNNVVNGTDSEDADIAAFCEIVYRLWFSTEVNALVASVYGDLKALNSTDYSTDYKKTTAYNIWYKIKNYHLPDLEKLNFESWEKLKQYNQFKISDLKSFKKNFIKQTKYKLNDFFHKINKTASLYYEDLYNKPKETLSESKLLSKNFPATDLVKEQFDIIMECKKTSMRFWELINYQSFFS